MYIEDKNIAIEYDGYKWHESLNKISHDQKKEKIFNDSVLKVIRIKDVAKKDRIINGFIIEGNYYLYNYKIETLNQIIQDLILKIFNKNVKVDIKMDSEKILQNYIKNEKNQSIMNNDYIIKMWNYEKNRNLDPSYFKPNSDYIVWWKCSKGHEFKAKIHSMNEGKKCPECKKCEIKKNSLLTTFPNISKEWNYKKNGNLTPDMVEPNSNKKVWWKCSKGHEWQAVIATRRTSNCPICGNKLIIAGINDIKTLYPELEKEWDYEKNNINNVFIDKTSVGTAKKVWWKCSSCGNSWRSSVLVRTNMRCGCPKCSRKKAGEKFSKQASQKNNLKKLFPELCDDWDYSKNEKNPEDYSIKSGKRVWWKCSKCGYEWESYIYNRTTTKKCPKCKK